MNAFVEMLAKSGMDARQIAREFDVALADVEGWKDGQKSPPDRVTRTLSILADFSVSSDSVLAPEQEAESDDARKGVKASVDRARKSLLGQFLTPASIAEFMASLFSPGSQKPMRLLDAGAGKGALSAAVADRFLASENSHPLEVCAYELDADILPELRVALENMEAQGVKTDLIAADFIASNAQAIRCGKAELFTHAILNPPYKKIAGSSEHRGLLRLAGLETVNLYSGFVGLALEMLEQNGELIAIIPRSFCNGPYYRPFRKFILERGSIEHIHLFTSRTQAFKADNVLQENIIIKLKRGGEQQQVCISTSSGDDFRNMESENYPFGRIVFADDPHSFIHIPSNDSDDDLLQSPAFIFSLEDLGVRVSTGPVVDFRLRQHLREQPEAGTVPLIYPGHFVNNKFEWPRRPFKKSNAICNVADTRKWLYPKGYYAVIRRFSSKEEPRRINANVIDPASLPGEWVGIENHLNVLHDNKTPLTENLAHGLAVYLNSTIIDRYFRRFNGHTQVNATDLKMLPYPSRETLLEWGSWAKQRSSMTQDCIDDLVSSHR